MKLIIALALAAAPSALAMAPYVPDDEGPTAAPTLDPTPGPTPQPMMTIGSCMSVLATGARGAVASLPRRGGVAPRPGRR